MAQGGGRNLTQQAEKQSLLTRAVCPPRRAVRTTRITDAAHPTRNAHGRCTPGGPVVRWTPQTWGMHAAAAHEDSYLCASNAAAL
jgi:hypothetical protein